MIAATATAGIPHAAWIADKLNLPMVYVRGKAKDHGKENLMEGILKKGQTAAVIEDLVSTGESAINSVNAIRTAGGKISYVFSIITFCDVVQQAQKLNYNNKKDTQLILGWTADPATWGKRMGFE